MVVIKFILRQGGQRKRWEDNIREWTGLDFGKSQRAVENGGKWRKLVAKSSVVPQRTSQLRDWLIMMMMMMSQAFVFMSTPRQAHR